MAKKSYFAPTLLVSGGGAGEVTGQGTGQGTYVPEGMTFEDWWENIALEGSNLDADYNGDEIVDEADYLYYIANELWKG